MLAGCVAKSPAATAGNDVKFLKVCGNGRRPVLEKGLRELSNSQMRTTSMKMRIDECGDYIGVMDVQETGLRTNHAVPY
jgi:hypothetical protein